MTLAAPSIDRLLALDIETRLALVQELWDSIVEDAEADAALPVTSSGRELLEARLKEDDDDPAPCCPWEEARTESLRG